MSGPNTGTHFFQILDELQYIVLASLLQSVLKSVQPNQIQIAFICFPLDSHGAVFTPLELQLVKLIYSLPINF